MEEDGLSDYSKVQGRMQYAFGNIDNGCRGDGVLFHFLSHPEIYLRVEAAAKVGQFRAQENKEFIIFVGMGSFPADRRGENLPSYRRGCSGQCRSASKVSLGTGYFRKRRETVKRQNPSLSAVGDCRLENIFRILSRRLTGSHSELQLIRFDWASILHAASLQERRRRRPR